MNKNIAFSFVLLLTMVFSAVSDTNSRYSNTKDSIINFKHVIYFDENLCSSPELIRELEIKSGSEFLNKNLSLSTGSGFVIDEDGYAITNRHVIEFKDLQYSKGQIIHSVMSGLFEEFGSQFSDDEIEKIENDFLELSEYGQYKFVAEINGREIDTQILQLSDEDSYDLALVKLLEMKKFKAIPLQEAEDINDSLTGERIYSFGYPLSTTLEYLFDENVVTMNEGHISAFRIDNLGIQHNAAISPGNSGGPLINAENKVVGVNTAYIKDGNSLFFAIGADKVRDFLEESGYGNLLKWNKRIQSNMVQESSLSENMLGELESSSDLLIASENGSDIYIDGLLVGQSPMYYTLRKDVTGIRIVSSQGEFSAEIRRLSSLQGTTELIPSLSGRVVSVSLNSDLETIVSVYGDGRYLGNLPLEINLPEDEYLFSFRADGYMFNDIQKDLSVEENRTIELIGNKASLLTLDNLDYSQLSIEEENLEMVLGNIASVNRIKYELISSEAGFKASDIQYSHFEKMYLTPGNWSLQIIGIPLYENVDIPFLIEEDLVLDMHSSGGTGSLNIRNYSSNLDIFIDKKKVESPDGTIVKLPLGIRNIYIWNDGHAPFISTVKVRSDNNSFITYKGRLSHGKRAMLWGAAGLAVSGAGVALALVDTDPYALNKTDGYSDYVEKKQDISTFSSMLIITGTLALIPVVIEMIKNSKEKKNYRKLLEEQSEK